MRTLGQYRQTLDFVLNWSTHTYSFECRPSLEEVFQEHPRLIAVLSHSTPLSWVPAACLLGHYACLAGGAERTPLGIMDRFFFRIPLIRYIAEYVTQSSKPMSFDELKESFQTMSHADAIVFPEGSNCFFGSPDVIQPFRSPRFVELSIRTNTPILLAVHHGSENWAAALKFSEQAMTVTKYMPDFLAKRINKSGIFALPLPPRKIPYFRMLCELYEPKLKLTDLKEDSSELKLQIELESEQIRQRMAELLSQIKPQSKPDHATKRHEHASQGLNSN